MNEHAVRRLLIVLMGLALAGPVWALANQTPKPEVRAASPAVHISMADVQKIVAGVVERMKRDSMSAVVDQPIRVVDAGGYNVGVAVIRRTKPEAQSLLHDQITEVYYVLDGTGTLTTGGTLVDAKPPDAELLKLVGPGATGTAVQGGRSQRVTTGDIAIISTGTPHMFTALDGAITYVIIRIDTGRVLSLF